MRLPTHSGGALRQPQDNRRQRHLDQTCSYEDCNPERQPVHVGGCGLSCPYILRESQEVDLPGSLEGFVPNLFPNPDAVPAKEHIFVGELPTGVRLVQGFSPRSVPVNLPAGLLEAVDVGRKCN